MFIGQFEHSLDAKNRLFIPAKFRQEQKKFIATCGLENCLFLFAEQQWDEISQKLKTLPLTKSEGRKFVRLFASGAQECEVDVQGRILLPKFLLEHAHITAKVKVIGVINRLEIWDYRQWTEFYQQSTPEYAATAEKLTEMGI